MDLINAILGTPLGYAMFFCFLLVKDYGWAIILFTVITKVVLLPLSLSAQKNSIKIIKLQPQLDEIKQRYQGNSELVSQEQAKLYKQEKYSPLLGMLSVLLQVPLVLGIINVVYNPLQHLFHLGKETIALLGAHTAELTGAADLGYAAQLHVIDAMQGNPAAFQSIAPTIAGYERILADVLSFDRSFMGFDLLGIPSLTNIDSLILIPLLSGISALIMCVMQNKLNVLQREQGAFGKWGMTAVLVAFSTYFAFIVPAGIGLYWIAGNLLSIVVMVVCNWVYNPRKYIDYENRRQRAPLTAEEKREKRLAQKAQKIRAKADSKRFFSIEKQLVFYSEGSGFYKYFSRLIDYITSHSDLVVHYVTSDPEDRIFQTKNDRIRPYFIGDMELISFMMKMDADMMVMTMPDLGKYHIKRSIVRKDVEYVYLDHGMTSFHMMLREGALDHYDTIFCYGPNHIDEIRETERIYELPAKKLVPTGYGLLDTLLENVAAMERRESATKSILIGPSWHKDNIMEFCLHELVEQLVGKGYRVIVRPHPEFVKRFPGKMKIIMDRYQDQLNEDFIIEADFSSNVTVYSSDLIITDWSSIAQEFSYATKKPSLFINTPMKVMNPEYKRIPLVPLDISLRDQIGVSIDHDQLHTVLDHVNDLFARREEYAEKIAQVLEANIFNIGNSAKAGGDYIISTLRDKRAGRETANTARRQDEESAADS
jgi:YidC/Oxa1 family membrane protein insertase